MAPQLLKEIEDYLLAQDASQVAQAAVANWLAGEVTLEEFLDALSHAGALATRSRLRARWSWFDERAA